MVPASTRRLTPALANTLPNCFVSPRNSTAAGVAIVMSVVVSEFGRESQRSASVEPGKYVRFARESLICAAGTLGSRGTVSQWRAGGGGGGRGGWRVLWGE